MTDEFIDDQPPIGTLTPEARESLRLAIESTPADHPDRARHTPGPWTVDQYRCGDKELIVSEAGAVIDIDDCTMEERQERFTNARLIASSPDLLMALSDLRTEGGFRDLSHLEEIDALIAKATGERTP